jgi:hypothetical protein
MQDMFIVCSDTEINTGTSLINAVKINANYTDYFYTMFWILMMHSYIIELIICCNNIVIMTVW